jgi:peptidyl-prolyl cis-trans isomerase SurA
MSRLFQVAWFFALLGVAVPLRAGDIIERIVAVVNGHMILQSDWDDAVRFEAFTNHRGLDAVSQADRAAALDRLIDQELLREQSSAPELHGPPPEELRKRVNEIRESYPEAAAPDAWRSLLARYGLDEKQLEARLGMELSIARQVEARLRPNVQIDPNSVESYYRDQFLPGLRQAGAQEVPLDQVSGEIREVLTQQKLNELVTSWLQSLRAESRIRTLGTAPSPPAPTGGQAQ